jgi:hypothetical protein
VTDPEYFGLTKAYVTKVYKKHKEPVGGEGNAREEIMGALIAMGWVRARYVRGQDSWTFQVRSRDDFPAVKKLCKYMLKKSASEWSAVIVIDLGAFRLDNGDVRLGEVAAGALEERKKKGRFAQFLNPEDESPISIEPTEEQQGYWKEAHGPKTSAGARPLTKSQFKQVEKAAKHYAGYTVLEMWDAVRMATSTGLIPDTAMGLDTFLNLFKKYRNTSYNPGYTITKKGNTVGWDAGGLQIIAGYHIPIKAWVVSRLNDDSGNVIDRKNFPDKETACRYIDSIINVRTTNQKKWW